MIEHKKVKLIVGFDVDQVSDQLAHVFIGSDGSHPHHPTGLLSNEIYFNPGESFEFEIKGGGNKKRFESFQVVDCCIVTLPKVISCEPGKPTRYSAPSPFLQAVGASYQLPLDFVADQAIGDDDYRLILQHWKQSLDVSMSYGRWEFSLTLTVRIDRGPLLPAELRVFFFDPETQVGTGTTTE